MKKIVIIALLLAFTSPVYALDGGEIIRLSNAVRAASGVTILVEDVNLSEIAQERAEKLAGGSHFSHIDQDGETAWVALRRKNYSFISAGENLARWYQKENDVVLGWIGSRSHRENLLRPVFNRVGVGVSGSYVVMLFSRVIIEK